MNPDNAFQGIVEDLNNATFSFVRQEFSATLQLRSNFANLLAQLDESIRIYQETGSETEMDFANWNNPEKIKKTRSQESKENVVPNEPDPHSAARPRRNAFKEASENINVLSSVSTTKKLRRPPDLNSNENIYVKLEKVSISDKPINEINIKSEKDLMPAPTGTVPKKKKKNTEKIRIKQEKHRDSDVIIEEVPAPSIILIESDEEETEEGARSSRLKSRKNTRTTKRPREEKEEEKPYQKETKRSKADAHCENGPHSEVEDQQNQSVYEDAVENTGANETFIASKEPLNETVVLDKPTVINTNIDVATAQGLLTDDESVDETKNVNIQKKKGTVSKGMMKVFSPYEKSPVKKKVEAYEKLLKTSALPVANTRTRGKAGEKNQEKDASVEKSKLHTPAALRFHPGATSTITKATKPLSSNESLLSAKSTSAIKASAAQLRERERRRKEKEDEAQKKKEAILNAQTEEKKRKREEKLLKVQLQREALEKEKQRALETQKFKEDRHKQLLAEQEERRQKIKEETEKKRMLAKKKALDEKKGEETHTNPIYMVTKAPLLPSQDCYDSDEDTHTEEVVGRPEWTNNIVPMGLVILAVGDKVKNSFFCRKAQSPDLREIFGNIDKRKLKRSSSAIWHKPPRFTMMPGILEKHDEFDEESDED